MIHKFRIHAKCEYRIELNYTGIKYEVYGSLSIRVIGVLYRHTHQTHI